MKKEKQEKPEIVICIGNGSNDWLQETGEFSQNPFNKDKENGHHTKSILI